MGIHVLDGRRCPARRPAEPSYRLCVDRTFPIPLPDGRRHLARRPAKPPCLLHRCACAPVRRLYYSDAAGHHHQPVAPIQPGHHHHRQYTAANKHPTCIGYVRLRLKRCVAGFLLFIVFVSFQISPACTTAAAAAAIKPTKQTHSLL